MLMLPQRERWFQGDSKVVSDDSKWVELREEQGDSIEQKLQALQEAHERMKFYFDEIEWYLSLSQNS